MRSGLKGDRVLIAAVFERVTREIFNPKRAFNNAFCEHR